MKKYRLVTSLIPIFLGIISTNPAYADGEVWTQAASSCTIDESSRTRAEINAARIFFAAHQTGTIVARCNVTNSKDNGANTGWNRLEVVFKDSDGIGDLATGVIAVLYRVGSSGGVSEVATFNSTGDGNPPESVAFAHVFNFDTYSYFVELRIRRAVAVADMNVSVSAIRLHD